MGCYDLIQSNNYKIIFLLKMHHFLLLDTSFECSILKWKDNHIRKYEVVEVYSIEKAVQVIPHFGGNDTSLLIHSNFNFIQCFFIMKIRTCIQFKNCHIAFILIS
jgi:hypothetical protein